MKKEAFAEIVMNSGQKLYYISKAILKNDSDCEDAVQEAITVAFAKLSTLRQEKYAQTWLIKIMVNTCYKMLRERKRFLPLDQMEEEASKKEADYSELYQGLLRLKTEYREVLVLFYLEEFSIKEIGIILDIPEGTVKSRLSRGKSRLKDVLQEQEEQGYETNKLERELSKDARVLSYSTKISS